MKISIITPVYNSAKTLETTIQSIINQKTTSQLEYIIVDGGSNDGGLEIIQRYLDHIDIFISETDKGVYDAMNKGIARATGDIIGIINADDWYNDKALEAVETIFTQEPDVSIVYSPIHNYFDGKYLNTFTPGKLENLVFKFTLNHPSCFVRKSVYDQIGVFDLTYSMAADYDFIFRAYKSGVSFRYLDTPLVSYSLNGMTGKPSSKFKQIHESWRVASKFAQNTSKDLEKQRQKFYLVWLVKEYLTLPFKQFIKPHTARKIKAFVRNILGGLPSDRYGAW
ncbi:MAG: glycosyltransferase [Cyanomargarita calcarea GSE-NOS-MK-12-04C]|jgi:glycosyltransferase involved in cell wall biosynthesis|uniref:Glycosyltransferase n=1 Tax=Cyanomargarita calcarea GSE-NOS-MK-12-04C TaxID=2839659 RepID=A0A951QML5_9CYAN|nr:glycosyltransferase [Cyanomargarita calcarea GSE-NOS-MK-12-04C]